MESREPLSLVAGLLVIALGALLLRHAPASPAVKPAPVVVAFTAPPSAASGSSAPTAAAAAVPAPTPPASAGLPPLPEVDIKTVPIHGVPAEPAEPPGQHRGVSDEVANGAHALGSGIAAPKQFNGAAQATGPVELQVGAVPVRLFGVKAALPTDHCGIGAQADCAAAARRGIAAKLSGGGHVACQTPIRKPGSTTAFAICLDEEGVDLGGYLVSQGLVLSDTGQSYDYIGAESIARNAKRGLWGFR